MKIEEFINKNKRNFEEDLPAEIWAELSLKIPTKKQKTFHWFRWAAGILVALCLGFWIGRKQVNEDLALTKPLAPYQHEINVKKQQLEFLKVENPQLHATFIQQLNELNRNFHDLKSELETNPNQEMLLEAMKENLQWQINILTKQSKIATEVKRKITI